jgi:hypothetical protein
MAKRIFVSTRKGLFTIAKAATGWEVVSGDFIGDNVSLTFHDTRDDTTYAALNHGHFGVKLHRRHADGPWEELAAPAYPPKPEGLIDLDGWGKPVTWTTQMIWAMEPAGTKTIWCGTMPGGLFRSDDRGESWQLIASLWHMPERNKWLGGGADIPGIHAICVDPRAENTVRVAVSCGGVWVTHDGGATWACKADGMRFDHTPADVAEDPGTQDPHMMVQCQSAPDRLWVQHHCGIYISSDCAESWQPVYAEPSSFGFGVVVHPNDPDTAWFVPGIKDEKRIPVDGKLVVTRTRDGGKSFDILRHGLPQHHAYDLILRHALAIDNTGTTLAFGSTTGGLWLSEDQGDHWQTISHSLPPVYAVRFG